jgi:cyclase
VTRRVGPASCIAALLTGLGALGSPAPLVAQRPATPGAVETVQVRPNVYVIFNEGSNVTAHLGDEGVVLVDSGAASSAAAVLKALSALTARPIRLIINTSADPDHVGGNATLADAGVSLNPNAFNGGAEAAAVFAHENVLVRMSAPSRQEATFPVQAWPTETYTSRRKSMYLNGDGIQVIRQSSAHSDGDSIVFFRKSDVIATGDIVDLRTFPRIDPASGGTIQGEIDALNELLELAVPAMPLIHKEDRTLMVPGHGRIMDHADVVDYRDMVTVIRDHIQNMIDKRMTLEQVKAANPTQGYRKRYGSDGGAWTTDMFVEAIYKGLTKSAS